MDFSFLPDPERARCLDGMMRHSLADSLVHISERAQGHLGFDEVALSDLCDALRVHRFPATVFGLYYQLVEAIASDDQALATGLIDKLVRQEALPGTGLSVFSIEDSVNPLVPGIYRQGMDTDPDMVFGFLQPPADMAQEFRIRLESSLARFEPVLPDLLGEVRGIVNQIVLAVGEPDAPYQFDGGSSYQLWGALFLNPNFHPTEIDVIEVVAHESAHSLLFGFTTDEPLQLNPDDALYESPLRVDPRPMDGIYHATFVSARMHWAMTQLIESGSLAAREIDHAQKAREADARNFAAGAKVIDDHGILTRTGAALFENARAYMA